MMRKLFKKEGYVCKEASDGDVAVKMVRESMEGPHPGDDGDAAAYDVFRFTYDVITMDNVSTTIWTKTLHS